MYFRLQAKKGLVHDERTKSLTFLQAVREPAYVDVITTLQALIDTYLSKLDFGCLPPNLCMMGLAAQMNKNAWARVREVIPRVARLLAWDQDDWHPSPPEIQGFHLPRVFRTENPRDRLQYGNAGSHTPDRRFDGRDGRGAQRLSPQDATRGFNRRPAHDGPRAGTLGLITIAGSGIRPLHVRHANDVANPRRIAICLLWLCFWRSITDQ